MFLFTHCSTWESGRKPPPGSTVGFPLLIEVQVNLNTGDLTPLLLCHIEAWPRERLFFAPSYPLFLSTPEEGERAGPKVVRAGELPLCPTGCNTRESGPCTSPRRHNRAIPVG